MTREEAIYTLRGLFIPCASDGNKWGCDRNEALDMAIEALQAEYEDYEHATLVDIKEPLKVSVVRCKDCEYAEVVEKPIRGMWCTRFPLHDLAIGDDCFCSWAKMKGGAE